MTWPQLHSWSGAEPRLDLQSLIFYSNRKVYSCAGIDRRRGVGCVVEASWLVIFIQGDRLEVIKAQKINSGLVYWFHLPLHPEVSGAQTNLCAPPWPSGGQPMALVARCPIRWLSRLLWTYCNLYQLFIGLMQISVVTIRPPHRGDMWLNKTSMCKDVVLKFPERKGCMNHGMSWFHLCVAWVYDTACCFVFKGPAQC